MFKTKTESRMICHLTRVQKSLAFLAVGGDSGGGVYRKVSGGVSAVGMVLGGPTGDDVRIHEYVNFVPAGWRLRTR